MVDVSNVYLILNHFNFYCFVFAEDTPQTQYCEIKMTDANLKAFSYAVKNHYWYQMYIDDLPIWGEFCPEIIITDFVQ